MRLSSNVSANQQSHYKPFLKLITEAVVRRCSEKFHNIHRKTPLLESLFDRVAGLQAKIVNFQEQLFGRTSVKDCFCY